VATPDGTWSVGAAALTKRVSEAVAARELSVPGAAQAFAIALEKQAMLTDETEALLSTLQFWARGVCK
jgi:hypothetical protein